MLICPVPNPRLSDHPPVVKSLPACLLPCFLLLVCMSALLIPTPRLPDYPPADGTPSLPDCLPVPELWPAPVYSACLILIICANNIVLLYIVNLDCPVTIVSLCTWVLPNPPVTAQSGQEWTQPRLTTGSPE